MKKAVMLGGKADGQVFYDVLDDTYRWRIPWETRGLFFVAHSGEQLTQMDVCLPYLEYTLKYRSGNTLYFVPFAEYGTREVYNAPVYIEQYLRRADDLLVITAFLYAMMFTN